MTTGEVIVHEVRLLDGAAGEDEPFLRQGQGSAFETRLGEVVWLRTSAAGLPSLPAKVKRLVDGGLHALVVSLQGVESVAEPKQALASLLQAARLLEQFGGWMRVAETSPSLARTLTALPGGTDVTFLADRASALDDYRRHAAGLSDGNGDEDPLSGMRSDQLPIRPRDIIPPRPDDWGWTVDPTGSDADLPIVEVAELFVEETELPDLLTTVKQTIARGKRHVTLRIQFQRGAGVTSGVGRRTGRGEELAALTEARDHLARAGGQLVLAGLQSGFKGWLSAIGGFQIVDDADRAEKLHRLHVAGRLPAPETREARFRILTQARDKLTIRPRELDASQAVATTTRRIKLLRVDRDALARLSRRIQSLPREGIEGVVVDLGALASPDFQAEPLVDAALTSVAVGLELACCDVHPEVKAYLRIHGMEERLLHETLERAALHHAERLHAKEQFQELALELSREDLVESAERAPTERGPAPAVVESAARVAAERAAPAPTSNEVRALREEAARLRAERTADGKTRAELEQALERERKKQSEAEQAVARAERRVLEQERAAAEASADAKVAKAEVGSLRGQLEALKKELEEARTAIGSVQAPLAEAAAVRHRVAQLERDKARILTEAEQEIERLTREQEALREELESAGEMIERLGKELEHS